MFNDTREPLVEVCSQLLAICFEKQGEEKIAESIDDENGNKVRDNINRSKSFIIVVLISGKSASSRRRFPIYNQRNNTIVK